MANIIFVILYLYFSKFNIQDKINLIKYFILTKLIFV